MLCNHDLDSLANIDGLYRYALFLTRNDVEAEDLVQETYVRAVQAKGSLRPGSNLRTWLFTILRNVWLNQLRKQRLRAQSVEIGYGDQVTDYLAETTRDAHDIYMSKLEAMQVRAAIDKLPMDSREVILLREYEELSYSEIAKVLDCPLGTVMSRLARARVRLRTLLTVVI